MVDEARSSSAEFRIEFTSERFAGAGDGGCVAEFGQIVERFGAETFEELRVDVFDKRDHGANDGASFAWSV